MKILQGAVFPYQKFYAMYEHEGENPLAPQQANTSVFVADN